MPEMRLVPWASPAILEGWGGGGGVAVCFWLIQPAGGWGGAVCLLLADSTSQEGEGGCCSFLADSTNKGRGGCAVRFWGFNQRRGVLSVCFRLIQPSRGGGGGLLSSFGQFNQWCVCMYENFYYGGGREGGGGRHSVPKRGAWVQGA